MKKICFAVCFCGVLLAGCISGGFSTVPRIFDLGGIDRKGQKLPCQIRFAIFRNISGSDRRFFIREEGNRMESDEFNRWSQDPELLLERFLRNWFSCSGKDVMRIRCVITAFELDAVRKQAVLSADFTLFYGSRQQSVTCRAQKALPSEVSDRSSAAAQAMSECAVSIAQQLGKNISEMIKAVPAEELSGTSY